jgi:hypothetical protein
MPDRHEQVDAPLEDVRPHSRMRCIEVPHGAVGVARKNGNMDLTPQGRGNWYTSLNYGTKVQAAST